MCVLKTYNPVKYLILRCILLICFTACNTNTLEDNQSNNGTPLSFYYGADLSYVNEMKDCGAFYRNSSGNIQDPYQIFKTEGANLVRIRLWHNPTWTNYSNLQDVKQSIQRAKNLGMHVLLDFHYSDTWADPSQQQIPAAWFGQLDNTEALGELLYNYTYDTLLELLNDDLAPKIVQIGNEINGMILQDGELTWPIDWDRNSYLLNKGIEAVRSIAAVAQSDIEIMLHIAQPENGIWWFEQAHANGVTDYDWIGLSYYPIWSDYDLENLQTPLSTLINSYNKKLMIVETAYPYTLVNADNANNILGPEAVLSNYPASQQGQLDYLHQLQAIIQSSGGQGLVYWEPAWVSTNCFTLWAQGSHWDNATLFDHNNTATLGIKFYNSALTN